MESVADRTETHAVVDNNIQSSSKDISIQLSTLLPLTIECAIGLIVGGARQMQLLLLLFNPAESASSTLYGGTLFQYATNHPGRLSLLPSVGR